MTGTGRPALDLDRFRRMLLESAGVGLALVEPETLAVVYRNRRFADWFPASENAVLTALLPGLDVDALRDRLERRGDWTGDFEVKPGRRAISVAVRIANPAEGELPHLVLECQNVTKLRELEYMIESYSKMIEKQNRNLQREKARAEKLLLNIMPRKVYEEVKAFGVTTPQRFPEASILLLDFVGFTKLSEELDPASIVSELNDIFTSFDRIAEQFGCERIKTTGDAYMAVCGVPESSPEHAQTIAKVALLFVRYLERRNESHTQPWRCRVGIASGPVIGSIVGVQKYVYDIFGPAVNLAARMESLSEPMEITLEESMRRRLGSEFRFAERGMVEVKGFGPRRLYVLEGETRRSSDELGAFAFPA